MSLWPICFLHRKIQYLLIRFLPQSSWICFLKSIFPPLSANERFEKLEIRLITSIHLHGIKPSCTNNHIFRSRMFPLCAILWAFSDNIQYIQSWSIMMSSMVMFSFLTCRGCGINLATAWLWNLFAYPICPNLSSLPTTLTLRWDFIRLKVWLSNSQIPEEHYILSALMNDSNVLLSTGHKQTQTQTGKFVTVTSITDWKSLRAAI